VNREQAWEKVSAALKTEFGRLLSVRDVRRIRRAAGEGWTVTVALCAPSGDLHVADVLLEQSGAMVPVLDGDAIIQAVHRAQSMAAKAEAAAAETDLASLSDFGDDEDESNGSDDSSSDLGALNALEVSEDPIEHRIDAALLKASAEGLHEARELLPRLLGDHEKRGATLLRMADVETKLGAKELAKSYLEAAAREFGDRFDMRSLEIAAAAAMNLVGKFDFSGSPIHLLLEESRVRLRPIKDLYDCRSLQGMPEELRTFLDPHVALQTLGPGEVLVAEGSPSRKVFIVRSGLLGVWLEKPSGDPWLVRCCFPGWLLGESSVLYTDDPRCTATLKVERLAEVWTIPAHAVKAAMEKFPEFAARVAETKQLHRIDSFFSMHETMAQLDVQVRDEMLCCMQRLQTYDSDTVVFGAADIPSSACLVARGALTLTAPGKNVPSATIGPDGFYGVRDSMHQIASGLEVVAKAGSTIAFFDADKLRALCLASPEHVVAILERLG
jgi:Cyclic nucleotide-binding domain